MTGGGWIHVRDYRKELEDRVAFIRARLPTRTQGRRLRELGRPRTCLVGILCRAACENTLGVLLRAPQSCVGSDTDDALALARQFGIETPRWTSPGARGLLGRRGRRQRGDRPASTTSRRACA
jgi:hypothetical protein